MPLTLVRHFEAAENIKNPLYIPAIMCQGFHCGTGGLTMGPKVRSV